MPISSEMMGITLVSISVTVYNGRRDAFSHTAFVMKALYLPPDATPPAAVAAEIAVPPTGGKHHRQRIQFATRVQAKAASLPSSPSCTADCHRVRARCRRISQRQFMEARRRHRSRCSPCC